MVGPAPKPAAAEAHTAGGKLNTASTDSIAGSPISVRTPPTKQDVLQLPVRERETQAAAFLAVPKLHHHPREKLKTQPSIGAASWPKHWPSCPQSEVRHATDWRWPRVIPAVKLARVTGER